MSIITLFSARSATCTTLFCSLAHLINVAHEYLSCTQQPCLQLPKLWLLKRISIRRFKPGLIYPYFYRQQLIRKAKHEVNHFFLKVIFKEKNYKAMCNYICLPCSDSQIPRSWMLLSVHLKFLYITFSHLIKFLPSFISPFF